MNNDDVNAVPTIESEIALWRSTLRGLSGTELDELTDHVTSAAHELGVRGLSPNESVLIAARRLGNGGELEREFARGDGRWRLESDTLGMLMLGAAAALLATSIFGLAPLGAGLLVDALPNNSPMATSVVLAASLLVPLVAFFGLVRARTAAPLLAWLQRHPRRAVAAALVATVAPSVLGAIVAHFNRPPLGAIITFGWAPPLTQIAHYGVKILAPIALIVLALRRAKRQPAERATTVS